MTTTGATVYVLVYGFNLDEYTLESRILILQEFQGMYPDKEVVLAETPREGGVVVGVLLPPEPLLNIVLQERPEVPHVLLTNDGLRQVMLSSLQLIPFPAIVGP